MALNFNYKKYKDVYTITNTGLVNLTCTIKKKECDSLTTIKTITIKPSELITLPITIVDGVYSIVITDNIETQTLPDILQYSNLLTSFILNVENTLCGCKSCNECDDCNNCEVQINTINQALAFSYVNYPVYTSYINTINKYMQCSYTESVLCTLTNSMINGNEDTKRIFLQIIAMHYLGYYLVDLSQATDIIETDYIKVKYKSTKIIKCIRRLGIEIEDIIELFLEDMKVYYWQLNNPTDNINDIIPLFTSNYLLDKEQVPFEDFEQGKIVTYNTIGRIAFAVKETDILSFILLDSLGNDITNEFDTQYFPLTRTVLFVSKIPYANSNIFFKFKKLIFLP